MTDVVENFYPDTDHYFLSNFFESPFDFMGVTFKSNEHFYQAAKAVKPEDAQKVIEAKTPKDCKYIGRRIKCRKDWDDIKLSVMWMGLRLKFEDTVLKDLLLETGDAELKEGNRWGDRWYGVDEKTGEGENHLGILLMRLREKLKDGEIS